MKVCENEKLEWNESKYTIYKKYIKYCFNEKDPYKLLNEEIQKQIRRKMLKRNAILLSKSLHSSDHLEIKAILQEGKDQNFIFPILKKGYDNNIFTFSHPSFKEYFLFLDIYQDSKKNTIHPLLSDEIIKNPLLFEFLALCANYNKNFEQFLLQQIYNSKTNKNVK